MGKNRLGQHFEQTNMLIKDLRARIYFLQNEKFSHAEQ